MAIVDEISTSRSFRLYIMLSAKIVRPSTSVKHKSSRKREDKQHVSPHEDADEEVTGRGVAPAVADCRRFDRLLIRHKPSALKAEASSRLSRHVREKFRTESEVLPCDWTDNNHFAREGRQDLRESHFGCEQAGRISAEPIDIVKEVRHYASEECTPETFNYFANVIRKRVEK